MYKFLLSLDASFGPMMSEFLEYLLREKLISGIGERNFSSDNQECGVYVYTPDRNKLKAYLRIDKDKRESNDPGHVLLNWMPISEISGKPSRTGKEGRLAAARKRNARKDKKIGKER